MPAWRLRGIIDRVYASLGGSGRKLQERVHGIRRQLHILDPDMIHDMVAQTVLEEFKLVRGKSTGEALLRTLSRLARELEVPGSAYAVLDIAYTALDLALRNNYSPGRIMRLAIDAYQNIKIDYEAGLRSLAGGLERALKSTGSSVVATINYATGLERALLGSRGLITKVYVVEQAPVHGGRRLAANLRRNHVNAYYLPDTHITWAVEKADAVVVYVLGATGRHILGDVGSFIIASTAKALGVPVIALSVDINFYNADRDIDIVKYKVDLASRYGKLYDVEIDPFELIPYEMVDYLIASEHIYSRPTSEALSSLASGVRRRAMKGLPSGLPKAR